MANIRIGNAFDVHAWSDDSGRTLVLGGVVFEGERGLQGHSDADVITHSCIDAILSAAGCGDIGALFPDTNSKWKNADSLVLLEQAVAVVDEAGWAVSNVDCTVVTDTPKISPFREKMQKNLTQRVGGVVSVKGKRTEGMLDLMAGIRCYAVALLEAKNGV